MCRSVTECYNNPEEPDTEHSHLVASFEHRSDECVYQDDWSDLPHVETSLKTYTREPADMHCFDEGFTEHMRAYQRFWEGPGQFQHWANTLDGLSDEEIEEEAQMLKQLASDAGLGDYEALRALTMERHRDRGNELLTMMIRLEEFEWDLDYSSPETFPLADELPPGLRARGGPGCTIG